MASVAFIVSFAAVATQTAPSSFFAPVRGRGLQPFTTAIVLVDGKTDGLILAASAAAVALVLAGASWNGRGKRTSALPISGMLILSSSLWALFGDGFLLLLAAVGGLGVVYSIARSPEMFGAPSNKSLSVVLVPCAAIAATLGIAAFSRWSINMLDGTTPFSDWSWSASLLELKLTNLLYPLLPRLALFFLAAWAVRIILSPIWDDLLGPYDRVLRAFSPGVKGEGLAMGGRSALVMLVACMVLAAVVGAYVYLPAINPSSALVGVDVRQFYNQAGQSMFGNPSGALSYALSNDRSVYLLFQYGISEAAGSPDLGIRAMPVILSMLLAISTFWFVKVATGDRLMSLTAALFASCSFQVTAGIDGGLYANWLAMVETFGLFAALLLGVRNNRIRNLAAAAGLSVLLLFTHPWTWLAVMGIVGIYAVSSIVRSMIDGGVRTSRNEFLFLGAVLTINLLAEAIKRFFPTGSGLELVYGYTLTSLNPSDVGLIVGTLENTLTSYLAGAMANPAIIGLAIVGVLALKDLRQDSNRLLLCWTAAASVAAILTGGSAVFLQSRLLYIIPFQVFDAIGFVALLRFTVTAIAGHQESSRNSKIFAILAYLLLVSGLASYALQTVGYLYS